MKKSPSSIPKTMKTEQIPNLPANTVPWVMAVPVVSTRHIKETDNAALLEEDPHSSPMMARLPAGGYLLDIDDLGEWMEDACYSDAFLNLIETFHNLGFHHLRLDSEGQEYTDLPSFNW
jgi:hypothetical protein